MRIKKTKKGDVETRTYTASVSLKLLITDEAPPEKVATAERRILRAFKKLNSQLGFTVR